MARGIVEFGGAAVKFLNGAIWEPCREKDRRA
jgi:hypothetical protein